MLSQEAVIRAAAKSNKERGGAHVTAVALKDARGQSAGGRASAMGLRRPWWQWGRTRGPAKVGVGVGVGVSAKVEDESSLEKKAFHKSHSSRDSFHSMDLCPASQFSYDDVGGGDKERERDGAPKLVKKVVKKVGVTLTDSVRSISPRKCFSSRSVSADVEWLREESRKTMSALEYSFHGTVDLESDVPEMQGEEDAAFTCERFLKGFQYNRSKSFKNLQSYVMWRSTSERVREENITESLRAKKVYIMEGSDRNGGPCVLIVAKNHDKFKTGSDETVKLLTYSLDKAIALMDRAKGVTHATVILDLERVGWKSLDVEALKNIMLFFQNYFPERVSTAVFWKAPGVFSALWRVVKPFLSDMTRSKILFARTPEDLSRKVALEHLPARLGGKAKDSAMIPIDQL